MGIRSGISGFLGRVASSLEAKGKARRKRSFYNAAVINRLTNDWTITQSSPKDELKSSLRTLRIRSRDLARNNDYAKRYINMCKTNVVGHVGVGMQLKAEDGKGTLDAYANKVIESAWTEWGKVGNCDVTGRLSWVDCQKLTVGSVATDGEVLIRRYSGKSRGIHRYQIKFIDPDLLDENYNEKFADGSEIVMGIEYNSDGKATFYHIYTAHPTDAAAKRTREKIPASMICHWFLTDRIDQGRGVPHMVSTMHRLHMLGGYEEAELVASRGAAAKMGFIYNESDDGEYGGEEEEVTGATIQEVEPGVIERLTGGDRFESFDPQHPTSAFKDFVKALLRGVASGLNVSYVDLANDLEGVSYSSIRKGELADRDAWRVMQTSLMQHVITWAFEGWLENILSPQITGLPLRKFDKFNKPSWQPRGWVWVDPQKEVTAHKEAVKAGFKSVSQVILEQGNDPEDVFMKLKNDKELAEKHGLDLDIFMGAEQEQVERDDTGQAVDLKPIFDAYGVGVRAGTITPQEADEDHFRKLSGLPKKTGAVTDAWADDGGYRRPITLMSGQEAEAASDAAAEGSETEEE